MAEFRGFDPIGKFGRTGASLKPQSKSMTPENKKNKRLVALFLLGFVLLNYPILSLLNINMTIYGLPLLYIYIFGVWGLLIFLAALVVRRSKEKIDNSANSRN